MSGWGSAYPMPQRSGRPSTRSIPCACSRKTRSIVSGESSRTPSSSPPLATTCWTRATARALQWPLPPPISARRQPGGVGLLGGHQRPGEGLRTPDRRDRSAAPATSMLVGGITCEIRGQSVSTAPIWKSAPSGPGDLLGDELLEPAAVEPADEFADRVSEAHEVVAGRGSRLPPRCLGGEHRGADRIGSKTSSMLTGCSQPDTPEVCESRWRTSMSSLPLAPNSGQ